MKYVFLAFLMLFGTAQADEIYQEVTDEKGDVIGVVSTNDLTWRGCTEEDATQGRCDEADPVVCMTYSNDCFAACEGVEVEREGRCEDPPPGS